jgi:uncharacterized membrane protein
VGRTRSADTARAGSHPFCGIKNENAQTRRNPVIRRDRLTILFSATLAVAVLAGCEGQQADQKTAAETVSFSEDVKPLIGQKCLSCHAPGGEGYEKTGLDMASYEGLMEGTRLGPVIVPGDSLSSTLVILVEGRGDPSIKMPHGEGEGLTDQQIQTLRAWIDQGAKNN